MSKLYIPIIEGTVRPKRQSIKVARFVESIGKSRDDVEVELFSPNDFTLPFDGDDPENRDPRFSDITKRADGFFIVTPEYNHSFPGSLKRLLDSEFDNYLHKPVAISGVSSGNWGGVRVVESLKIVLCQLGLVPIKPDSYFPRVEDLFDEQGIMKPEFLERNTANIHKAFTELVWMAQTLKWGRENLPK